MGYFLFFITGLFFSMVGMGGGSVYVPFFTLLGFDVKSIAIPGGLFLVFITGLSSSINYIFHKQINYKIAVPILIGSISASLLSQLFFYRQAESKVLFLILCICIFISGLRFLVLPENFAQYSLKTQKSVWMTGILMGWIVGFISVMTGIGGGFLMVPALVHLAYPVKEAVGTSAFVILFTSLLGFVLHFFSTFDKTQFPGLLLFGLVVFAGALIGSKINATRLKSSAVRGLIGFSLTALGVYFFIREFIF